MAVRLPTSVVEALKLCEGDEIEIDVASERGFVSEKVPSVSDLLQQLRQYRGQLPRDFRFDRLDANEYR